MVTQFARSEGSCVHAVDGSGLTRSGKASTAQVVRLLQHVRAEPYGEDFIDSLAVAGQEGTVADRMHGTAAAGRCRLKTGTLTGVSALSGYCFNRSGRTMIFSVLMNGVRDLNLAHLEQDRIAAAVASYSNQLQRRARFVEDLGPELLGLGQLRARVVAGDDVVGLLRDRVDDLAARRLDQRRRLLAGQVLEGAGQDQGLALSGPPCLRRSEGSCSSRRPFSRSFSISSQVRSSASDSAICTAMIGPTPSTSSICSGSARGSASIEPKWSASASAVTKPTPGSPSA